MSLSLLACWKTQKQDQPLNTEGPLVLEASWESMGIADSVFIKGGCKLLELQTETLSPTFKFLLCLVKCILQGLATTTANEPLQKPEKSDSKHNQSKN